MFTVRCWLVCTNTMLAYRERIFIRPEVNAEVSRTSLGTTAAAGRRQSTTRSRAPDLRRCFHSPRPRERNRCVSRIMIDDNINNT